MHTIGHYQVENNLQEFIQKVVLKIAAQDILQDMYIVDIENDKEWEVSRHLAWQQ